MKNKKIILFVILGIFAILIIYALLTREDGERVLEKDKQELTEVTNYSEFLSINSVINDYLLNIPIDNQDAVKALTGSDVIITNTKEKDNYYLEKLYYVELKFNIYYYATGRKMIYDYNTSKMSELKNDCYLVNVYKPNNTYKITKINDINNYYNENDLFDKVVISNNDYNDFDKHDLANSDELLYNNYINYFKDLVFVNYQDAYNLLDISYKNAIGSLDEFYAKREDIYKKLNNLVKDYSIKGDSPNRTYTLLLFNDTKITITETGIMNVKYKIEN